MPPLGKKRPTPDKPFTPKKKSTKRRGNSAGKKPQPAKTHPAPEPATDPTAAPPKERLFEHGDFQTVRPQRLILAQNPEQTFEATTVIEGEAPSFEPPPPPKPIPVITPLLARLHAARSAIDRRIAQAFPSSPKYLVGTILAATAIFITITIAGTSKLVYDRHFASPKSPSAPPPPPTPLPLLPTALTHETEQGAYQAIKAYLEADGIGAKLPFIRHPEKSRPAMEAWYSNPAAAPFAASRQAGEILFRKRLPLGTHDAIALAIDVYPEATTEFFLVEHYPDGQFKVDWESSSGYQPMPLPEFKAKKPTTPIAFRITALPSDYYNFGFTSEKFDCYRLTNPADPDFLLYGYVDKLTDFSRQLRSYFHTDGTPVPNSLILELGFPQDATQDDQVIIHSLTHPHWLEPGD